LNGTSDHNDRVSRFTTNEVKCSKIKSTEFRTRDSTEFYESREFISTLIKTYEIKILRSPVSTNAKKARELTMLMKVPCTNETVDLRVQRDYKPTEMKSKDKSRASKKNPMV